MRDGHLQPMEQVRRDSSAGIRWTRRTRRRATMASAAAVIFLVFAFAASATAASPAAPPVKTVQVDVIGDSLSTGYRTPGDTWPGQAQKIVAGMGLNAHITNASENGAGYVQPGQDGDVFLDLVNRIVNSHAQVVVLFGSDNDAGRSGEVTAVQAALARVKALAPHAAVILVGPTSESDDPTGSLAGIRQTLATAASGIGATFVDPISLGWFQGSASADLSADLEHPNTAGELYLAQHMTAVMAPALKTAMQRNEARAGWPVRVRLTDAVRAV